MRDFLEDIDKTVWKAEARDLPWHLRYATLFARLVVAVARDIQDGSLSLRATSLVYTTLLSLAPLLAICFSVIKGFGAQNQIEPFLAQMLSPLGAQSQGLIVKIMEFVDNINVGVLGALGVGLLVFSVLSLMQKIEESFNQIWNVSGTRPLISRVRDYMSVLLVGPLFIFLSMGMTASLRYEDFMRRFVPGGVVTTTLEYVLLIMPFVLFALAFTAIYMFIPNTRVRLVPALTAGVVTAMMWKLLGWLFGVFVAGSGSYAAIYSAFAALVLFMIWLYVAWLVVLVGASISYYLQNPTNQRISRHFRQLSLRVKTKMALMLVTEIGRVFYEKDGKALTLQMLAARMRVPARAVEDVANNLLHSGILAETADGYIPGRPFEATSVFDMLYGLRAADEEHGIGFESLKPSEGPDRVLELSDRAQRAALEDVTLKQLAFGEVKV